MDDLRRVVAGFFADLAPLETAHARINAGPEVQVWRRFSAELGLGGGVVLGVPSTAELAVAEAAVVAEEAGRVLWDGRYLSTWLAAGVIAAVEGDAADPVVPEVSRPAIGLDPTRFTAVIDGDQWTLKGSADLDDVDRATHLVVAAQTEEGPAFFLLDCYATAVVTTPLEQLDLLRTSTWVRLDRAPAQLLAGAPSFTRVHATALAVLAAESLGAGRRVVERTVAHCLVRTQFGRPLASFQAVKHRLASMHIAMEGAAGTVAAAVAAVDATDETAELAARIATVAVHDAFRDVSHASIQLHGGLGFTWEHEAHLFHRRAVASTHRLGSRREHLARISALSTDHPATLSGLRHSDQDEPGNAPSSLEGFRRRASEWLRAAVEAGTAPGARSDLDIDSPEGLAAARAFQKALHGAGLAGVALPRECGGAGRTPAFAQAVLEAARDTGAGQDRLFQVGADMIAPAIAHFGTDSQKQDLMPAVLAGAEIWCELFSEPDAGSDLASLRTRAVREGDAWRVSGQKVWASYAHLADHGLLLARTDPQTRDHRGLTMFVTPMQTEGIDIRPLRQLTGENEFNEVFLDDVRLPAGAVLGNVGEGWAVARHVLRHERLALAVSSERRVNHDRLTGLTVRCGLDDEATRATLAEVLVREEQLRLTALRVAELASDGSDPGPMGSVLKVIKADVVQRSARVAMDLLGENAISWASGPEGDATADIVNDVLRSEAISIAGGTTHIQLNIVAESLLGLPRDERPTASEPRR